MWENIVWVSNLKMGLSMAASLATMAGIIALFFTIKQYKQNAKNREIDVQMKKTDYDIKVLKHFSEGIIEQISEFKEKYKKETDVEEFKTLEEGVRKQEIAINIKLKLNIIDIFNKLEKEMLYITSGITHEQVLYNAIGSVTCRFMIDNFDIFERVTSERAPYDSLNKILKKWCVDKDIDHLVNQKTEIEKRIKRLENKQRKSFQDFE